MKKTSLILSILFGCGMLNAQTTTEKRGAKLYDQYDYLATTETLEKVENKNTDVLRKLANSYEMMQKFQKSEDCWKQICSKSEAVANDFLSYARILMKNQKYTDAEIQLKKFAELNPQDEEAARFAILSESLTKIKQNGIEYGIINLAMNTAGDDFSPVFYKGQMYFASTRYEKVSVLRSWNGNHLPFLDICMADLNQNEVTKWAHFENKKINKKYHEGPIAFSADGKEMYITRNNYSGNGSNGVKNLSLVVSTFNGSEWSEPVALPFNSQDYSVGHATVSPDGNTLFFASDMPGGKGGVDLYMSKRTGGQWSTPVNVQSVNTSGNEMFPYIHKSGILLFSSNGHPGFGGLDLFVAQLKEDKVSRFYNVGSPLNSSSDDFSVWMNDDEKTGFYSSNRKEGKGSDDIYSFTMSKPFSFGHTLHLITNDEKGAVLTNTELVILDAAGKEVWKGTSDEKGQVDFETDQFGKFKVIGVKKDYFDGSLKFDITEKTADEFSQKLVLEKDPGFAMLARLTDKSTGKGIDSVKVTLINNMTGEKQEYFTDETGAIFRPISDKKLNERISYNFKFEKSGYIGKGTTYNRLLDKRGTYIVSDEMNFKLERMSVGLDLAKAIDLKPIYFDLAKFNIRPDAALELDKIVQIMNEYPTMVLELGSHTDCRGTAAKNQELSQKRAMASAEYIKARISNPSRIYGMGYGESKIINGCKCEGKKNPKYTEEQHKANRRTEFLVINI